MIVEGSTSAVSLARSNLGRFAAVIGIVFFVEVANNYVEFDRPSMSLSSVALLVTALSIFLVFRVNEAYQRWWEARTLWGGIVNNSRSFARQVCTLIVSSPTADSADCDTDALRRELIYRQVAWVQALRLRLRGQDDCEPLRPFLPEGELESLAAVADKPSHILLTQAARLAGARAAGCLSDIAQHRIEGTLSSLQDAQGGCERIKNTPFPDRVVYFTRVSAWGLALLIPVALIDKADAFDPIDLVVVPFMMMAFLVTERLGAELKNPFENRPNDTPMSALCRTIEIGLRQHLGETELPPPLEPVDGVLM